VVDPADEHEQPSLARGIHGELLKLGFEVAQSSVDKYMVKRRGPPGQGWLTFLAIIRAYVDGRLVFDRQTDSRAKTGRAAIAPFCAAPSAS
jgi:hypothetical protein